MGRAVILNEEMKSACGIDGTSRDMRLSTLGRYATPWIAAAMLATAWVSETRAFPEQARDLADAQRAMAARNSDSDGTAFEALPPSSSNDKSTQMAQAT